MSNRNNINVLIDKANFIYNYNYDYSNIVDYKSMHSVYEITCKKHNYTFKISLHSHINKKRGCKYCALEKFTWTTDLFKIKANLIHDNLYNYDKVKYVNSKTKVIINCIKHGDFLQKPNDHINLKQGCPICKESKGELKIRKILDSLNIKYIYQKSFDELKYKSKLFFDFYLPEHNICIEYDGEQHFKPIDGWGGQENYEKLKIRDELKNDYCKNNNIKLVRINYLENMNELKKIENILNL